MSDLKDWCYRNNIEWHTTTTEAFRIKSALEELWNDEVETKEAQLKIAIEALEFVKEWHEGNAISNENLKKTGGSHMYFATLQHDVWIEVKEALEQIKKGE